MTERIQFVDYKGKKILLEDFSNIKSETELIALMKQAGEIIRAQPKYSVLVAVDMTNARYSPRVVQASKEVSAGNTIYIRASTLVGISAGMNMLVQSINAFTGRKLKTFATREEAMEWLIAQ